MKQGQGCQRRNYIQNWMILTLLAASVLPGTTRLVSAEEPEPGTLLLGAGVNSDAGVTGTIVVEPADSSVSAKTAAIAGDVLTAKFFTVPIALFEELNLPSKTMKTLELEPQPVLQDERRRLARKSFSLRW